MQLNSTNSNVTDHLVIIIFSLLVTSETFSSCSLIFVMSPSHFLLILEFFSYIIKDVSKPSARQKVRPALEPVSSHVMLIKIYFVVRPLKKGLNSCWCSFKSPFFCTKCPFWLTSEVGPIFQIKLWYLSPTFQF